MTSTSSPNASSGGRQLKPGDVKLRPIQYDEFALSTYKVSTKLRGEGIIPPGVRFQVCLPTPINTLYIFIAPAYRTIIEPLYQAAMFDVPKRIQECIPAHNLAIQFDAPAEIAFLEGKFPNPVDWSSPLREGLIERIVRLAIAVDPAVELGFHFWYGDFEHKHFVEPKDTSLMTKFANDLFRAVPRRVNWIHMPVPKDRTDIANFASLKELQLGDTELYLGLIHRDDLGGTEERISTAQQFVSRFRISTECGLGEAGQDELGSVLEVARTVLE